MMRYRVLRFEAHVGWLNGRQGNGSSNLISSNCIRVVERQRCWNLVRPYYDPWWAALFDVKYVPNECGVGDKLPGRRRKMTLLSGRLLNFSSILKKASYFRSDCEVFQPKL